MKVSELIKELEKMDGEMEIRFRDTYWENEGYGKYADDLEELTNSIGSITVKSQGYWQMVVIN